MNSLLGQHHKMFWQYQSSCMGWQFQTLKGEKLEAQPIYNLLGPIGVISVTWHCRTRITRAKTSRTWLKWHVAHNDSANSSPIFCADSHLISPICPEHKNIVQNPLEATLCISSYVVSCILPTIHMLPCWTSPTGLPTFLQSWARPGSPMSTKRQNTIVSGQCSGGSPRDYLQTPEDG